MVHIPCKWASTGQYKLALRSACFKRGRADQEKLGIFVFDEEKGIGREWEKMKGEGRYGKKEKWKRGERIKEQ